MTQNFRVSGPGAWEFIRYMAEKNLLHGTSTITLTGASDKVVEGVIDAPNGFSYMNDVYCGWEGREGVELIRVP